MRFAVLTAMAAMAACAAQAQASQSYDELKSQVVVRRYEGGRVLASSAAFAVEERTLRYLNGGKGGRLVSVLIEAWPDKPVTVSFSATSFAPLLDTEVSGRDGQPDPDELLDANIGPPWSETTARQVENQIECSGGPTWCMWTRTYMIDVPQDLVFEIVADENRDKLGMSIGKFARHSWQLPREHLIVTLDAIGLLNAFSPAQ